MLEATVQLLCRVYLKKLSEFLPIDHWRIPVEIRRVNGVVVRNELKGFPDILVCYRGIFIGVECKSEKGKLSVVQKLVQNRIVNGMGQYVVVRSLGELSEHLAEIVQTQTQSRIARSDKILLRTVLSSVENIPRIRRYLDLSKEVVVESDSDSGQAFPQSPFCP